MDARGAEALSDSLCVLVAQSDGGILRLQGAEKFGELPLRWQVWRAPRPLRHVGPSYSSSIRQPRHSGAFFSGQM